MLFGANELDDDDDDENNKECRCCSLFTIPSTLHWWTRYEYEFSWFLEALTRETTGGEGGGEGEDTQFNTVAINFETGYEYWSIAILQRKQIGRSDVKYAPQTCILF